jgi:hypothetical protein
MIPVDSSWIAGLEYDESGVLQVILLDGRILSLPDQPAEVVLAMIQADSKGRFFNQHFRRPRRGRGRRHRR